MDVLWQQLDRDFDDFVVGRSSALMRTAVLLTAGDRGAAEDMLQTALMRLAIHWRRAREHPDAYVRRVLTNLAHDAARRRRRRPAETLQDIPSAAAAVADAGFAHDDRAELMAALRELPPRQRATVVLRFWEDLSVEETAAVLGCTTGTVKSTTARALERLRNVLHDAEPATEGHGHAD